MRRSSTSRRSLGPLLPVPVALVALVLLGGAWPFGRRTAEEPEAVEARPAQPSPTPRPAALEALFPTAVPLDVGPVPEGLANLSAQGCRACHVEEHQEWTGSAHATGWRSEAFLRAVDDVGSPACTSCHLPLRVQHPDRVAWDAGQVSRPVTAPNEAYSATLHTEGVTCAACHVRDGHVITAEPVDGAPHPTTWTPELTASETCATCHQLTWPGAEEPAYDTYGEWLRSGYAEAGVGCLDCHGRPAVGMTSSGVDHGFQAEPGRGVSLLVDIPSPLLHRGGDPLQVTITLQNTGAGHHFPTGSPWRGVRLEAALVVESGDDASVHGAPFVATLARQLEGEAPWRAVEDTRLPAGEARTWTWPAPLDLGAPSGAWSLRVRLQETALGEIRPAFVEQRIPLRVD